MSVSIRLATAAALLAASASASAVDFLPRAGVQLGNVTLETGGTFERFTGGPTLGLTAAGEWLFADVNFEALPMDIQAKGFSVESGWRSELGATLGVRVMDGVLLIAGYRQAMYGPSFGSSTNGTNAGPYFGVNFPELRLGSSNRDILSLSIAVQNQSYEDKINKVTQDSDVGVNIRLGYRRAGSPHSFGLRYQSFGSTQFGEYITTLQYSYVFGSF
jgi:hypothetical protein